MKKLLLFACLVCALAVPVSVSAHNGVDDGDGEAVVQQDKDSTTKKAVEVAVVVAVTGAALYWARKRTARSAGKKVTK
jgi:hypothetical protein